MEKENNKKQDCPLCSISDESMERLKKEGQKKKNKPAKKKKGFLGKIFVLILILILIGFVFYKVFFNSLLQDQEAEENSNIVNAVGSLAPDFSLEDVDGNEITLSSFRDKKPVLLVFWATWCSYCAKELPDLKTFTDTYRNELEIIVISSGENKETVKSYIQEKEINFTMLLDEERNVWNSYLVRGTPSHFLINSKGEIIATRPGLALGDDLEMMLSMLIEP